MEGKAYANSGAGARIFQVSRRHVANQRGVDGTGLQSVGGMTQKLCQRQKCIPTLMPVCHMAILFSYVSLGSQGRKNCPQGHSC